MKNEKTRVGKFLEKLGNKGINIARSIANGEGVFNSVLKAVVSKSLDQETADKLLEFHREDLKDVQNARDNETKRDNSKNAPFISKVIHELIALLVITAWIFALFFNISDNDLQLHSAVMLILGYLYGKSRPNRV